MKKPQYKTIGWNKYLSVGTYRIQTGIKGYEFIITNRAKTKILAKLLADGDLFIYEDYCFNVSGPVIRTENVILSALIHDPLCQAIDENKLPSHLRGQVDSLFKKTCLIWCLDGCSSFPCRQTCRIRAGYVYHGIRLYVKVCGRDKI